MNKGRLSGNLYVSANADSGNKRTHLIFENNINIKNKTLVYTTETYVEKMRHPI